MVDQHHALRGEQHRPAQRELARAQAFQAGQDLLRHRDVVGQQEAGPARERLLADRGALAVHHEQLVVHGQLPHQLLEAGRAHRHPGFDRARLVLAHAARRIQRLGHLAQQRAFVEAADVAHGVDLEAQRARVVAGAFQHQVDGDARAVRLRHEQGVHQRVRQDFGVGVPADLGQQRLTVGGRRPGPQDEGSHGAIVHVEAGSWGLPEQGSECTFLRGLRLPWPADLCRSCAPLQLSFDGAAEAVGAEGMLPLQIQADAVQFFVGDVLHDQRASGLAAFDQTGTEGEIARVRSKRGVRLTQGVAGEARPRVVAGIGRHARAHCY